MKMLEGEGQTSETTANERENEEGRGRLFEYPGSKHYWSSGGVYKAKDKSNVQMWLCRWS